MNEVIRGIASRRTIKRMEPDKLPPRTDIELIIEAATWAPNHHSTEPWRFVVLEGDSRKQRHAGSSGRLQRLCSTETDPLVAG